MNSDPETYHDYTKISRIFLFIDVLAWLLLGISVVVVVLFLSRSLPPLLEFFDRDQLLNLLATLPQLLQGAFYFALLLAIKEAIYIVLDIEENTRDTGKATSAILESPVTTYEEPEENDDDEEEDEEDDEQTEE